MTAAEDNTTKNPDEPQLQDAMSQDAGLQDHVPQGARPLTPEARRALEEAEARRRISAPPLPPEVGGRTTPEPTRYGDWEKGGIASDF